MFGFNIINSAKSNQEVLIDSSTPWVAASDGDLELLKKSLSYLNLNVGATDHNGYSLVHAAASYNQIEVLKWLMAQEGCGFGEYLYYFIPSDYGLKSHNIVPFYMP